MTLHDTANRRIEKILDNVRDSRAHPENSESLFRCISNFKATQCCIRRRLSVSTVTYTSPLCERLCCRNTTLNVGDNYSKIETAMATKIEREGNHPDETRKNWQFFTSWARMRRSWHSPFKDVRVTFTRGPSAWRSRWLEFYNDCLDWTGYWTHGRAKLIEKHAHNLQQSTTRATANTYYGIAVASPSHSA